MGNLKVVVRVDNKYRIGVTALVTFVALYALTNSLHVASPAKIPPTWIDEHVPLLPATVWVYVSLVQILVIAYVLEKDCIQLTRFVYAQIAVNLTCAVSFLLWPTTFVRPELMNRDGISVAALELVWLFDAPINCFPSLHVSTTLVAVLMLWRSRHRLWPVFGIWALAISLSTLTTKQHHSADVLAGVLVAGGMYWLFFVRASYQPSTGAEKSPNKLN